MLFSFFLSFYDLWDAIKLNVPVGIFQTKIGTDTFIFFDKKR